MMDLKAQTELLLSSVIQQFEYRTVVEGKKQGVDFGISLTTRMESGSLWFTFTKGEEQQSFNIPIPFYEDGVLLIEQNEVRRAVCPYFIREEDRILNYLAVMHKIILGDATGLVSPELVKKSPYIQQIVYSFDNGNTSVIIYNLQRAINEVVNRMPLHETNMNSWVMNHRLIIIDPAFNELKSPEEKLQYQIDKNKEYFSRGWTSIGMADGSLADKNYILTCDIRHLTPFGMKYHNPQRNLFSTLGMKGAEEPRIRSTSEQSLADQGIIRKGWNWFTLFVDVPDVFEDQILVNECHRNKFIMREKRYQCFGILKVKEGDFVRKGQTIAISDLGTPKYFDVDADKARVARISEGIVNVGGVATKVFNVIVEYKRYLRDAVKISNRHGNKGVIRLKNLGFAVDPRTGETRRIDVIASARSIRKRKNYGQVLEALLNNVNPGKDPLVIDDYSQMPMEDVKRALLAKGFPEDGCWACETYHGPMEGICGEIFWGVTASAENALWDKGDTMRRNTRMLRTAGLKFSHVEMRALETRFGRENPILTEILTYAQGGHDLHESLKMLRSKRGEVPNDVPVHNVASVRPVDQTGGTIVHEDAIKGTAVDEYFEQDGYVLELPVVYQTIYDTGKHQVEHEGAMLIELGRLGPGLEVFNTNRIYVPKSSMRRCWMHDTGKFGLNEIGVLVNNVVVMSHRYLNDPEKAINLRLLYNAIYNYFARVAKMLGTKRGEMAQLGMAVRYPFSSKAVATLSNSIHANTVEIHESMADVLRVKTGDVVLVERFPCLGFMSVRPQKVRVTKDEMARYSIRVSGNCLCSEGLDFDGDVIYIASFHTPEAKEMLRNEWESPNKSCYDVICSLNEKAGCPTVDMLTLDDYNIEAFDELTVDVHAELVNRATGVKSHTGPVIALAYNIMRILENSPLAEDQEVNIAIEVFLDRVGNTVFKQKHGVKSLHSIVIDAICNGDVQTLVDHGFDQATSQQIVDVIRTKANTLGVYDLRSYHKKAKEKGWSNIINRIVRLQNKIYFASRSNLEALALLEHVDAAPVDTPSRIFKMIMSGQTEAVRTKLEECLEREALDKIKGAKNREACRSLMDLVDLLLTPRKNENKIPAETVAKIQKHYRKFFPGRVERERRLKREAALKSLAMFKYSGCRRSEDRPV